MKNSLILVAMLTLLYLEGCHFLSERKKQPPQHDSIVQLDTHRDVSDFMLPQHTPQPHPGQGVSIPRPRPHRNVTLDSVMLRINMLDLKLEQLRKQPPPMPATVEPETSATEDEFYRFWGMIGLFILTVLRSLSPKLAYFLPRITRWLPPLTDIIEWYKALPRPKKEKRKQPDSDESL